MERRRGRIGDQPLLTGEATPDYLWHPHCAQRVFATVPQARLIVILRNPIDRAYSFYNHNLRAGLETLSFEDAVDKEEERLAGERERVLAEPGYFSFQYMQHSYLTRGIYVDQLQQWSSFFPKSQLLILKTEDLYDQAEPTLRRAFDFLGLAYHEPKAFKKLNAAPPYPDMDPKTRDELATRMQILRSRRSR